MLIQLKRGLSTSWATKNLVLSSGELGLETDTNKLKVGDGTTPWNNLQYVAGGSSLNNWSAGTSYSVGDIVVHQNKLYRCTIANNDSTWDDAKWQELGGINDWKPSTVYSVGDYVRNNNILYVCKTAHTSTTFTADKSKWDSIKVEDMEGATSSTNGKSGGVPAPTTTDISKYLKGDGTWDIPISGALNIISEVLWENTSGTPIVVGDTLPFTHNINDYDYVYLMKFTGGVGTILVSPDVFDGYRTMTMASMTAIGEDNYGVSLLTSASGTSCTVSNLEGSGSLNKIVGWKFVNPLDYSTSEKRVGTWIDGKAIYQKTFTGTFSSTTSIVDISSIGIDKFIDIDGTIFANNINYPVSFYYNSTNFCSVVVGYDTIPSNRRIFINVSSGITGTKEYFVTIIYTKT